MSSASNFTRSRGLCGIGFSAAFHKHICKCEARPDKLHKLSTHFLISYVVVTSYEFNAWQFWTYANDSEHEDPHILAPFLWQYQKLVQAHAGVLALSQGLDGTSVAMTLPCASLRAFFSSARPLVSDFSTWCLCIAFAFFYFFSNRYFLLLVEEATTRRGTATLIAKTC